MNLPNKITLSRILMIPVIVFFYLASFIPYGRLVATVLFVIARSLAADRATLLNVL